MTFLWFASGNPSGTPSLRGWSGSSGPGNVRIVRPEGILCWRRLELMVPPRGNPLKLATYNFRFPSRYDPLTAKEYTTQPYIMAHMNFWSNACLLNLVVWDDSHLNVHLKSRLWHWQTPGRSTKAEVSTSTIENAMYLRGKMMKLQLIQVLISTGISTWPSENGVYP